VDSQDVATKISAYSLNVRPCRLCFCLNCHDCIIVICNNKRNSVAA
jgi:hypothetical protein